MVNIITFAKGILKYKIKETYLFPKLYLNQC